ncbi:MAG: AMP-binding protein, partial [Pseudorhodobacter sp.]
MPSSALHNRRLFSSQGDWASLRAGFTWSWPQDFNIAQACCDDWAAEFPDQIAITEVTDQTSKDWSYGALKDASDRLASAFAAAGVQRGDRVAVLLSQSAAVAITHFAAMKLGAVALPLFTLFGEDALLYRLGDSGAALVVTDDESLPKLLK